MWKKAINRDPPILAAVQRPTLGAVPGSVSTMSQVPVKATEIFIFWQGKLAGVRLSLPFTPARKRDSHSESQAPSSLGFK